MRWSSLEPPFNVDLRELSFTSSTIRRLNCAWSLSKIPRATMSHWLQESNQANRSFLKAWIKSRTEEGLTSRLQVRLQARLPMAPHAAQAVVVMVVSAATAVAVNVAGEAMARAGVAVKGT